MQQGQGATQEFEDLGSHRQMWASFTSFVTWSAAATVVLLLLIAWITGVF